MLEQLKASPKVIGTKQVGRALKAGHAVCVFIAQDADPRVTDPVVRLCREQSVPMETVATMTRLGELCGIAVKSAVAAMIQPGE